MTTLYIFLALTVGVALGFGLSAILSSNDLPDQGEPTLPDDQRRIDRLSFCKWNVTNFGEHWVVTDGVTNEIEALGTDLRWCLDVAAKREKKNG